MRHLHWPSVQASVRLVNGALMSLPVIRTPARLVETRSNDAPPAEPRLEKSLEVAPSAAKSPLITGGRKCGLRV